MRRGRDEPEAPPGQGPAGPRGDPEEPIEDYSPFETFPLVLLYKLFVQSGWSVRDLRRFCSADKKLGSLCKRPNIWRRLYFLKVVRDPHLIEIQHRYPESDEYIQNVLVNTEAGREWASHPEAESDPFVLLIAFAFAYEQPATSGTSNTTIINWTVPPQVLAHCETRVKWRNNKVFLGEFQTWWQREDTFDAWWSSKKDFDKKMLDKIRPVVWRGRAQGMYSYEPYEYRYVAVFRSEYLIPVFVRLLKANLVPALYMQSEGDPVLPPALTKACLACGETNDKMRACGGFCGRAIYCGDECARAHWYAGHHAECK